MIARRLSNQSFPPTEFQPTKIETETDHAHGDSTSTSKQRRTQCLGRPAVHDLLRRNAGLDYAENVWSRMPKNLQGTTPSRAIDPVLGDSAWRFRQEALAMASSKASHVRGHRGVTAFRGQWNDFTERDGPEGQEVAEWLKTPIRLSRS